MIDTILFDLDGTLLQFSQDEFINTYFGELKKVFVRLGLDAEQAIKAVWAGTKAMVLNDGTVLNSQRFWESFSTIMNLSPDKQKEVEDACEQFYSNEFDTVKSILTQNDIPKRMVHALKQKGYDVILATNPLFPTCGVETRLRWIGLTREDFLLVTDYSNSTFCKPNPGYYKEIFQKTSKDPSQCIMAGNNTREDMSAGALGVETFLVTDCLENEINADISTFRHGTLEELEKYLLSI